MHSNIIIAWENTLKTVSMFENLGFYVHPEPKSIFHPSQQIEFLGFILNSQDMKIYLTADKTAKLKKFCSKTLQQTKLTIREIASLLGKITSSFPATKFGRLHYRGLE